MTETTTDWRQLPAGRELDALVAERVMRWRGPVLWVDDEEGSDPYLFPPSTAPHHVESNNRDWDSYVPNFTTDTNYALDVWSECQLRGWTLQIVGRTPLAICRAALAAVEAGANQP